MSTPRVPTLTNKACELSAQFKGSKMRCADTEGANGGDAGTFEPCRHFKVSAVKVSESFASEIAAHPGIFAFLFNYGPNRKIEGVVSSRVVKIPIREKFKKCRVKVSWGVSNELEFTNARISNIWLYANGAECRMDFNLQGIVPVSKLTMELEAHEGEKKITVRFGEIEESEVEQAEKQTDFVDAQNEDEASEGDPEFQEPVRRPGPGMPADTIN